MISSFRSAKPGLNKFTSRPHIDRTTGCAGNVILKFRHSLERGLREEFPGPQGELLATAVSSLHRHAFDGQQQRRLRDMDGAATLYTLLTGTADAATMGLIRSAMVSSALLADMDAVLQWAQAGLTRCTQLDGKWLATAPEWEWVLANRGYYIELVQDLARFLNSK
ncbi:MAG: hypothetical protein PCFJNLEI_03055 [Verrucomicrobiae bacterium]|nr:hypothetical protein [Verrucomicrobiae bacterium]